MLQTRFGAQGQAKCKSSGRTELDELVWKQTLEERDAGWLQGPYSEEETTQMVGSPSWLATRRFPLEQKICLFDDALASGLSASFHQQQTCSL